MKKLLVLFVYLVSLNSNCQDKYFGQWVFAENENDYRLINKDGIAVTNCKDIPSLIIRFTKEGDAGFYLYGSDGLFPDYTGNGATIEIKLRGQDGRFFNGNHNNSDFKITFATSTYITDSTQITNFFSVVDSQVDIDFFSAYLYDWAQVYFKTTLNGESKVFRFYLDGYKDAYDYFEERYDENIDPFE